MGIFIERIDSLEAELKQIFKNRRIKDVDTLIGQIIDAVKRQYKFRVLLSKPKVLTATHVWPGDALEVTWKAEFKLVDCDSVEVDIGEDE